MMRQTFRLVHREARDRAARAVASAPDGYIVQVREATRTLDQNALMWQLLTRVAEQVKWPVNGEMAWLGPEDWKQIFTAALKRHTRVAMGVDGGVVMLGSSSSRMTKVEFSDLLEVIHAFCAEREVTL